MYIIKTNVGNKIIWGKTQLDRLMMEVQINDYIKITFNGIIKTASGHHMHVYDIKKRVK